MEVGWGFSSPLIFLSAFASAAAISPLHLNQQGCDWCAGLPQLLVNATDIDTSGRRAACSDRIQHLHLVQNSSTVVIKSHS